MGAFLLNIIVALASAVAFGGLMCRVFSLDPRVHRWPVILMHAGMAVACLWTLRGAVLGGLSIGDLGAVLGALAWLYISLTTWRGGPPAQFRKG